MSCYHRLGKLPVDVVLGNVGKHIKAFGKSISVFSKRYRCYAEHGVKCVACGIEGHYFAVEKHKTHETDKYHMNLYHKAEDGHEVMMTIDHIIPLSKNGPDDISNLQTMCCQCNMKKADKCAEKLIAKP